MSNSGTSRLLINLEAIKANYRTLKSIAPKTDIAAAVKANSYGLGANEVASALAEAGCRFFYVAHLDEAINLSRHIPPHQIAILNSLSPAAMQQARAYGFVPVLNSLADIELLQKAASQSSLLQACIIHLDTGINRLGLPAYEAQLLATEPQRLRGLKVLFWASHLACADDRNHPLNAQQLARFSAITASLPPAPLSLANSSGVFLGPDYHFQQARCGMALYGLNPTPNLPNPMQNVVRWQAQVLQTHRVDSGNAVGYGASQVLPPNSLLAILGVGYADGWQRRWSNQGKVHFNGQHAPIVGRISMDLVAVDISHCATPPQHGDWVDLLWDDFQADDAAAQLGTIGYEVLTSISSRVARIYGRTV